jgi:hypothetical protein
MNKARYNYSNPAVLPLEKCTLHLGVWQRFSVFGGQRDGGEIEKK